MNDDEKYYWHDKLNYCWGEFLNARPELSIKYYNYFYGLTRSTFMLYLEQNYGILVTTNVEISDMGTLQITELGVDKVDVIDPNKKLILDLKFS